MSNLHQKLIDHITHYIKLNKNDIDILHQVFVPINVKKNQLLETENKPTKYLYFIDEGFVRIYYNKEGEERTTQINCPSLFITTYQSFTTNSISSENVETITDCKLLRITKFNLDTLSKRIAEWNNFSEQIYNQAVIYNEERTKDMILLNAEKRYIKLMRQEPGIMKNVPLQYIASYIGIKPESLSRIRKNLNS